MNHATGSMNARAGQTCPGGALSSPGVRTRAMPSQGSTHRQIGKARLTAVSSGQATPTIRAGARFSSSSSTPTRPATIARSRSTTAATRVVTWAPLNRPAQDWWATATRSPVAAVAAGVKSNATTTAVMTHSTTRSTGTSTWGWPLTGWARGPASSTRARETDIATQPTHGRKNSRRKHEWFRLDRGSGETGVVGVTPSCAAREPPTRSERNTSCAEPPPWPSPS